MATLPYVTAPGNIEKALRGIKSAATPERVNQDFVKTILQIPGGSGNQMTSFLKKAGFVNPDGTPSEIYKRFRNSSISTSGKAAADALKVGYAPLYTRNEYMHQLSDEKLKGLIIEETGQSEDSSTVTLTLAAIKALKKFADWSETTIEEKAEKPSAPAMMVGGTALSSVKRAGLGLNLSYTVNLNLPATSDVAVFNAIFKSLKENLLREPEDE
ncbi:MAG: DUF5343 domain-containing protein [Gammaproteobacteria bacterium]|nr:DUF5343 domain-containing protein [Gammaproteobacteria bacterium]